MGRFYRVVRSQIALASPDRKTLISKQNTKKISSA